MQDRRWQYCGCRGLCFLRVVVAAIQMTMVLEGPVQGSRPTAAALSAADRCNDNTDISNVVATDMAKSNLENLKKTGINLTLYIITMEQSRQSWLQVVRKTQQNTRGDADKAATGR